LSLSCFITTANFITIVISGIVSRPITITHLSALLRSSHMTNTFYANIDVAVIFSVCTIYLISDLCRETVQ